jgi:D-beta-D-heptose 7-phosphate kinase/D-beta-D-heptose 1-phosphate adenosyltransferase
MDLDRKPRIIVCGDIMLDHSITVQIEKIANEAPIPVYNFVNEDYTLGGCGNVLKNIYSLGCERVHIISAVGNDTNGDMINKLIDKMDISNHVVKVQNYNTTVKRRYFCDNKIMFRCDIENSSTKKIELDRCDFSSIIENILKSEQIDCIVLSDYNKGVLNFSQCQQIIQLANRYGVFTCVDPKENSEKYIGCSLIKPNRSEAYKLFKMEKSSDILDVHKKIFGTIGCKYSIITMSENGITLYDGKELYHEIPHIHKIIDVTGAGDIVCTMLSYFFWRDNISISKLLRLTTDIATKSVEYPGTYTITYCDIHECLLKNTKLIGMDELSFLQEIYHDKKVVFTNGCFDLLHKGHIETFKFCKNKGDILVVALNSDDSIRRLKGPTRPIQSLDIRLSILSAIEYIDYIIVFDEDTPYSIIKQLQPYYLVKGADYIIDNVVGKDFVKEVLLCNLVDGVSTTNTVKRIQGLE